MWQRLVSRAPSGKGGTPVGGRIAGGGMLLSRDREDGAPSLCVPRGEGTGGTWQLPTLPSLVG